MKLLLVAALLAATCQHGDPTGPGPTPPPVPWPVPDGGDDDASGPMPSPSPVPTPGADPLRACLDNFEALNPGTPEQQIQDTFCSTPEQLAPFAKRKP